jgi:hypothetical protein
MNDVKIILDDIRDTIKESITVPTNDIISPHNFINSDIHFRVLIPIWRITTHIRRSISSIDADLAHNDTHWLINIL